MTWNPIASAPRDGTKVILFVPPNIVVVGFYDILEITSHGKSYYHSEYWSTQHLYNPKFAPMRASSYEDVIPTHWMPLPALPDIAASK